MKSNLKKAFTIVELLVVLSIIATIIAMFVTSVSAAQERAKISRAHSEVMAISQAIMAYADYKYTDEKENSLPTMTNREATKDSLGFLVGNDGSSAKIPPLLEAQFNSGGAMIDPWGKPYLVSIREGKRIRIGTTGNLKTGYSLPNYYRLSPEERK